MSKFQRAASLLLSLAVTTGLATDVTGHDVPIEDDITNQLNRQQQHEEARRKELEMEANLEGTSLAETKRLMRQEMKAEKPAAPVDENDEGDITSSKQYRRQQRALSRGSQDASLLAGETMDPTFSLTGEAEEDSEKDFEAENEPEHKGCPEVYKVRGAEVAQPMRMGIFWRVPGSRLPLWENTNKEFLYYSPQYMEWRIGDDYRGKDAGVASTPNQNAGCPHKATDWFAFEHGNWTTEYNITFDVEECPIEVWIEGGNTSQATKMGSFYMTLHETFGRPVYENEEHQYLYYWPEFGEWRVGPDWTKASAGIASKRGEQKQCPTHTSAWNIYSGGYWQHERLRVYTERPNIFGGKGMGPGGPGGPPGKPMGPPPGEGPEGHGPEGHGPGGLDSMNATYKPGEFNENQCPWGAREMGIRECKMAAQKMGTKFGGMEDSEDKPRGCLMDKPEGHERLGHVFFNKHPFGMANEANQPLCHEERGMAVAPPRVKHSVVRLNAHMGHGPEGAMHDPMNELNATNDTASDEGEEEDESEFSSGSSYTKMFTKPSKKVGVGAIIVIGIIVLIVVIWFVRRRAAQQKEQEAQAALAATLVVGSPCTIKSSNRKAVIAEVGPDKSFKVTYDDDGKTSEEFIKIDDIEAPADEAPKKGQL